MGGKILQLQLQFRYKYYTAVDDWVDVIQDIYVMERLTFSLRLEQDKFKRIWKNWIEYIIPIRTDFF